MTPILIFLSYVFSICMGATIGAVICMSKCDGVLRINKTNPEKDLYSLEIEDLDAIEKRDIINIRIIKEDSKNGN